jgi:hypothetical protein
VGEADIVVAWLSGNGILARVMGAAALQGALGWIPFSEFGAKGIEVWVLDEEQAPAARKLLTERANEVKSRLGNLRGPDAPIQVICHCGHSNTFPAAERGRVEACARCGDFLDVEESDDDDSPPQSTTDRARKLLELANQEALRLNHDRIDTEHILLALVKEGSGVTANVLRNLGIELRKIYDDVESMVQIRLEYVTMTRLPLSSQARKVIEYATEEGRQLNHDYVGSEHILLGLLREKDGVGAQVLSKRGITLERVRDEVVKLLRG